MRFAAGLVVFLMGCRASATVERTMPVANLQTYATVALRVHSSAFAAQGQAMTLQQQVLDSLRTSCGFQPVGEGGAADVILDLNITNSGRKSSSFMASTEVAIVDALLVLTDGIDGQILGTAKIHGQSSGAGINSVPQPSEATGEMAKSIGELLAKSGCSGPRIARAQPDPTPPPGPAQPDESKRPQADALNEQGKEKLYAADLTGALALFRQANQTLPDAKYEFNTCLTLGALESWDEATASCKTARSMNPSSALAAKIDKRLEILAKRE